MRGEIGWLIVVDIVICILLYCFLDAISTNKESIQENFVLISDLTECMTELDKRMDSMEDRPEISISYGTVITTEDEIIIQEEDRDGE